MLNGYSTCIVNPDYDPKDYEFGGKYHEFLDDESEDQIDDQLHYHLFHKRGFSDGALTQEYLTLSRQEVDFLLLDGVLVADKMGVIMDDSHVSFYGYDKYLNRCHENYVHLLTAYSSSGFFINDDVEQDIDVQVDPFSYLESSFQKGIRAITMFMNDEAILFFTDFTRCRINIKEHLCPLLAACVSSLERTEFVTENQILESPRDFTIIDLFKTKYGIDIAQFEELIPRNVNEEAWSNDQKSVMLKYRDLGDVYLNLFSVSALSPYFRTSEEASAYRRDLISLKNLAFMCIKLGWSAFFYSTSEKDHYVGYANYFKIMIGIVSEHFSVNSQKVFDFLFVAEFNVYVPVDVSARCTAVVDLLYYSSGRFKYLYFLRNTIIYRSSNFKSASKFIPYPIIRARKPAKIRRTYPLSFVGDDIDYFAYLYCLELLRKQPEYVDLNHRFPQIMSHIYKANASQELVQSSIVDNVVVNKIFAIDDIEYLGSSDDFSNVGSDSEHAIKSDNVRDAITRGPFSDESLLSNYLGEFSSDSLDSTSSDDAIVDNYINPAYLVPDFVSWFNFSGVDKRKVDAFNYQFSLQDGDTSKVKEKGLFDPLNISNMSYLNQIGVIENLQEGGSPSLFARDGRTFWSYFYSFDYSNQRYFFKFDQAPKKCNAKQAVATSVIHYLKARGALITK